MLELLVAVAVVAAMSHTRCEHSIGTKKTSLTLAIVIKNLGSPFLQLCLATFFFFPFIFT